MKKSTIYFLAGAATGLALGIYLSSKKGSALREQLADHWESLVETFGERAQEKMDELLAQLNELLEKGMELVDNRSDYLEEDDPELPGKTEDDDPDLVDEVSEFFGAGMAKARGNLHQKFAESGLNRES